METLDIEIELIANGENEFRASKSEIDIFLSRD